MNRQDLRGLMDCCRPNRNDLGEPEMRALAEWLARDADVRDEFAAAQAWDRRVLDALADVPIPPDLAERLIRHVNSAIAAPASAEGLAPAESPDRSTLEREPTSTLSAPRRGRWLAVTATALAAIAALWLLVAWWAPWNDTLTASQIAERARDWINQLDPTAWRESAAPGERYPLDPSVHFTTVLWQPLEGIELGRAVAYQTTLPPDQMFAYLIVIPARSGRHLPSFPPLAPDSTTGNLCVGVWKNNQCLYVLLVPGNPDHYRRVLRTQTLAAVGRGPRAPGAERDGHTMRIRGDAPRT